MPRAMTDDRELLAKGLMTREFDQEWYPSSDAGDRGAYYVTRLYGARKGRQPGQGLRTGVMLTRKSDTVQLQGGISHSSGSDRNELGYRQRDQGIGSPSPRDVQANPTGTTTPKSFGSNLTARCRTTGPAKMVSVLVKALVTIFRP